MKSALFVDFDNVYSGLHRLDPATADRFARQPGVWTQWLCDTLALPVQDDGPGRAAERRRLLVRRCYLNPQVYREFRAAFNRDGFEIVDCPPMTSAGKTSTDIHMVLDIVDLLQHPVHCDEFIVFSADADFTPVLRKLRRWDRRTTVLAIGFPSAAYRASADLLIDQDEFLRDALGPRGRARETDAEREPQPAAALQPARPAATPTAAAPAPAAPSAQPAHAGPAAICATVAEVFRQTVGAAPAPVALASLAACAVAQVEGLDAAQWGGFQSLRRLVDALDLAPLVVDWPAGMVYDPARHARPAVFGPMPPGESGLAAVPDAPGVARQRLREIAALVASEVARAGKPVPCGRLAQLVLDRFGLVVADWAGHGTFRRLLEALDLAPLRIDWSAGGGRVLDASAAAVPADGDDWGGERLLALAQQVGAATGTPLLSPADYRMLVDCTVADLAERPFLLTETGKRVRDACREAGRPISRADVSFVLKGLLLGGHVFGQGADDAGTLAARLADNVLVLCRREQLALDADAADAVRRWLAGPRPASSDAAAAHPAPAAAP